MTESNEIPVLERYKPIREFLSNKDYEDRGRSLKSLSDTEIEDLVDAVQRHVAAREHEGWEVRRLPHNPREKAFHDQWIKQNRPLSWINRGHGILQDLFIQSDGKGPFETVKWVEEITARDRRIVATVIQWLGTNVGMAFLDEALKDCGHRIVQIDKK